MERTKNIEKHFDILLGRWTAKSSTVCGKEYPFQKGIVITSKSLVSLYDDLRKRFNINYLLTRRLNQDVLENFFGIIQQMGNFVDDL